MSAGVYVHCDAAGVARAGAPAETRNPTWVLITTILASGLAFLEGSVFNVGLPAIGETFNASASDLQWAINAYLLPLGALLLLGGAAGDRFGRVRLLVAGTALFGAASIGCALAATPALAADRPYGAGRRRGNVDAEQFGHPRLGLWRRSSRPGNRHLGIHGRGDSRGGPGIRGLVDRRGRMALDIF